MIPIRLTISGFLSYRDPVEIDFTSFDIACISGYNGAGKSSLLDAITWVLFGQARKRDDSLVNLQSEVAEVSFEFSYEGNTYRILRARPRGKTGVLEFTIRQPSGAWKPLTERTQADTQARIRETLRMDYETFVNAAFFLQGKADLFTTETPTRRKQILGSILGLDIWEVYRQRAAERRKQVQAETDRLDGRTAEIEAELAEETTRQERLSVLQADLKRLGATRKLQEQALEGLRAAAATLAEQHKMVETLQRQAEATGHQLDELEKRRAARLAEKQSYTGLLARAAEIETAYQSWQQQRIELSRLDEVAGRFREFENRRTAPLLEIESERVRLLQDQRLLVDQQTVLQFQQTDLPILEKESAANRQALADTETQLQLRDELQTELALARQRQADARAENPRLREEMEELKSRIDQLTEPHITPLPPGEEPGAREEAVCPLCGQPLSPADRQRLIEELTQQGKELGDRYRQNQALLKESDQVVHELEGQITALAGVEPERLRMTEILARLNARLESIQASQAEWDTNGAPRLAEVQARLTAEDFALEARARLAEIDAELKALGYDAAAHDALRQQVAAGQASEADSRSLEVARAALVPLERELGELETQTSVLADQYAQQQHDHLAAVTTWQAAQDKVPDLDAAETDLLALQEQENRLRLEVGAAQQKVLVLSDLRTRHQELKARRETLAQQITRFRQLDRALGKDGVPALLIEQALPQIETKANELLDRLSGGVMSVRFQTQSAYKDKRRDELKETLDILISDSAGTRDYELYSGGEAFRVNFAIRLALSEVLAQRSGARLQTLVIDEGFGSQDALGRQRLVEAINAVSPYFAKILVITHIEELKDSFPTHIEVEKTERGSIVRVI
jgi:exonuclease SbcC